jgi:FMN-dependent NADH-azoreductase
VLYSKEQINKFAEAFRNELLNDEIVKRDFPNQEVMYYQSAEQDDLKWVQSANPNAKLFRKC